MNKYDIKYYKCNNCGFVQTEDPFWLEESYQKSINTTDTGILKRNIMLANFTTILISLFFNKTTKFLDYAGGYGLFTRIMRDIGFDFYWDDKYSDNLVARGFEHDENYKYELLTSFESFEHFASPINEFEDIIKLSENILFSTTLLPIEKPAHSEWDYYGIEHGQHIALYSLKTIQFIADKYDFNFYSNGKNIHLLSRKKINNTLFKILYILSRLGFANLLKPFLLSKTLKDSLSLKKQGLI